jgi:hypothetical protein
MPPRVITNTDPGNFQSDGVYNDILQALPAPATGPQTDLYAIVGGANDGPVNVFTRFSDSASCQAIFGTDTMSDNALVRAALSAMPEGQAFGGVRATDGTDVAATITVPCGGLPATGTLTIGGSPMAGDTVSITLTAGSETIVVGPYTVLSTDTTATIAAALVALFNRSFGVGQAPTGGNKPPFMAPAVLSGSAIKLSALVLGSSENSIMYSGTATGSHTTITPTAPTALSGGVAPSGTSFILTRMTTGSRANGAVVQVFLQGGTWIAAPVIAVVINYPNAPAEGWNGLIAYATAGGAFDAPTFNASLLAAVNGSVRGVSGSSRWTASAGSGTQPPTVGATSASGGTDGTSGLTSADLIGVGGIFGRTGMQALSGLISGAQFAIAGLTDPTVAQTLEAFAIVENAIAHWSYPEGTTTAEAILMRSEYDIAGASLITDMDWDSVFDDLSGTTFYVPPQDKLAGVISGLPSYVYPGNQPVGGVAGVNSTDQIVGGINLVSSSDSDTRQQNGLLYLNYMPRSPRGPALGLPHGMMSDGVTPINDARMLKLIVDTLSQRLGVVVGEAMNTDPTSPDWLNPAGRDALDIATAYLGGLKSSKQITSWQFLLGSDNTQTTAVQGFLIPRTSVVTNSEAQYILNIVQVGRAVQIQVTAAS